MAEWKFYGRRERLLFLWNLFEGVPKFYRDCYEQEVLAVQRKALLRRIFFESSSPLRSEAENWFLRELRGRFASGQANGRPRN